MENLRPVIDDYSLDKIRNFITNNYGIKLDQNKRTLVESRLGSRVRSLGFNSYQAYLNFVFQKNNKQELNLLVDLITTNKTDFFRESAHFDYLYNELLPEFIQHYGYGQNIKIWSAACSSGEEVYTLAMVLEEFNLKQRITYSLSGSDISLRMLEKAKSGVYPLNRIHTISDNYRKKYMMRSKNPAVHVAKIKPEIRKKVAFFQKNLIDNDYGNEKYHVIFCRNVLIYFDKENQEKVINRLARQLLPGGYLFLGHSESALGMKVEVKQVRPTIYRRKL